MRSSVYIKLTIFLSLVSAACTPLFGGYVLLDTGEQTTDPLTVQIRGVGAPAFSADQWTSGPPHLVADVRHPLLEPRPGRFRNIYAPTAVPRPDGGWYVYYGAWDGIDEGRDAIYVTTTNDFVSFGERPTVISPGPQLQHVCNVNGQITPSGGVSLMCTAYPDKSGLNKPVLYSLPTAIPDIPLLATQDDMVHIQGYENYAGADINGMNVLLRDGDRNLLYFGDFKNFGRVNVAVQDQASTGTFQLVGTAMDAPLAVNDVKILHDATTGKKHYLMGLHMNRGALYYALSEDPLRFTSTTELLHSSGNAERYMVAIGWVTDKDAGNGARRVLGVLYGAGAAPSLDANRIFARWFQKSLHFSSAQGSSTPSSGSACSPTVKGSFGPSTAVVTLPVESWTGSLTVTDAANKPAEVLTSVTLTSGHAYELLWQTPYSAAFRNRRSAAHLAGAPHDPNCDCPELPWMRP